ncbi:MAG: hypothetical protein ABJH98_13970 [Reichenbachiella sp.]|uniref:hypothetical protein n=1 Tax=Reichenbachiella sp. TaxID=2184521 RepID=UPI00329733A0
MKIFKIGTFMILSVLLMQCGSQEETVNRLNAQIDSLKMELSDLNQSNMKLTLENDDHFTVIQNLNEDLAKLRGDEKSEPVVTSAIRQLIKDVHLGWEDLGKSKSKELLMANFLEKYSVNAVRFDLNNNPNAKQSNYKTFEAHLDELIERQGISINFGKVEILSSEIKEDFFYVAYKTTGRVYQENKEVMTKSLISVISGRITDKARIGNYSWVAIDQ